MDKQRLVQLARRLYTKWEPKFETPWDKLPPERAKEWRTNAAKFLLIAADPRFEDLLSDARSKAAAKAANPKKGTGKREEAVAAAPDAPPA